MKDKVLKQLLLIETICVVILVCCIYIGTNESGKGIDSSLLYAVFFQTLLSYSLTSKIKNNWYTAIMAFGVVVFMAIATFNAFNF